MASLAILSFQTDRRSMDRLICRVRIADYGDIPNGVYYLKVVHLEEELKLTCSLANSNYYYVRSIRFESASERQRFFEAVWQRGKSAIIAAIRAAILGAEASEIPPPSPSPLQAAGRLDRASKPVDFPRLWSLLPLLLPRQVRERTYTPAHLDLLQDYVSVRNRYRTRWARRWVTFCFTVRTAVMVLESLRAWIGDKALCVLMRMALALLGGHLLRDLMRIFSSTCAVLGPPRW